MEEEYSLSSFKSAVCRVGWRTKECNVGMWLSENRTEIAPIFERHSRNGEVSGSIPNSVTFSCCWFKKKNVQPLIPPIFSLSFCIKLFWNFFLQLCEIQIKPESNPRHLTNKVKDLLLSYPHVYAYYIELSSW